MLKAVIFPGQGSQQRGMGETLFPLFPELIQQANTILNYSIEEICLENPKNLLHSTEYTQPALYVVNALSYYHYLQQGAGKPDYVAGHSLGEYNALLAAEVFDFQTGLTLVKKRGSLMSQAPKGGMAAVLEASKEQIQQVLEKGGFSCIEFANFNAPSQIVLSGDRAQIIEAAHSFQEAKITYIPLNVSGAFHSNLMQGLQSEFTQFLRGFLFQSPKIPVISNLSAKPYSFEVIMENLSKQLVSSVQWQDSVFYMMCAGVEAFEEIGPSDTLTKLVSQIQLSLKDQVRALAHPPHLTTPEKKKEIPSQECKKERQPASQVKEKQTPPLQSELKQVISSIKVSPESLGNASFRKDHGIRYAYASGSMYKGIGSKEIVIRMGKAGLLGFLGTAGMSLQEIEKNLKVIQSELTSRQAYGCNLLHYFNNPEFELQKAELFLKYGVTVVEASAFIQMTPALVFFRLKGIQEKEGSLVIPNSILAKASRPEVAEAFMSPPPEKILSRLLQEGKLTQEEVNLGKTIPVAHDITVEADSAGHTDGATAYALFPAIVSLKKEMMRKYSYQKEIRVGAAGGLGTPESIAASFFMGADYVITGSINQCSVESGTSDQVKEMLQSINVQDTTYAPAGDMFEIGARVQVLRREVFFPARANKLYEIYQQHSSWEEIDTKMKKQIEKRYFQKTVEQVWEETKAYYQSTRPEEIEKAEKSPKHKMALVFKWYFAHSSRLAFEGNPAKKVDFQIHCGPAQGSFNQWVKGTELESWKNRHVDQMAEKLMQGAAEIFEQRLSRFLVK